MNLALFGGFDRRPIGPGWTKETLVAVLGGRTGNVQEGSGPRIRVNVYAIFGGVEVKEPKPATG